jgi:hypothetical protein
VALKFSSCRDQWISCHRSTQGHIFISRLVFILRNVNTTLTNIRFEVSTAVNMKNVVFLDLTAYGSCKNRSFGGAYCLHHKGEWNQRISSLRASVAGNVPSSLIISTLIMDTKPPFPSTTASWSSEFPYKIFYGQISWSLQFANYRSLPSGRRFQLIFS